MIYFRSKITITMEKKIRYRIFFFGRDLWSNRHPSRESESKRKEWKESIDATGNVRYAMTKNRTTSFIFQPVARAAVVSFFARREKPSETYTQKSLSTRRRKTVFFDNSRNSHEFLISLSLHHAFVNEITNTGLFLRTLHLSHFQFVYYISSNDRIQPFAKYFNLLFAMIDNNILFSKFSFYA